jgi:hypothetical protein
MPRLPLVVIRAMPHMMLFHVVTVHVCARLRLALRPCRRAAAADQRKCQRHQTASDPTLHFLVVLSWGQAASLDRRWDLLPLRNSDRRDSSVITSHGSLRKRESFDRRAEPKLLKPGALG